MSSTQPAARPAGTLIKVFRFSVATLALYSVTMFFLGVLALLIIDGPLWYDSPSPRAHSVSTESPEQADPDSSPAATAARPHFDPHRRQPAADQSRAVALPPAHHLPRGIRGAAPARGRTAPGTAASAQRS